MSCSCWECDLITRHVHIHGPCMDLVSHCHPEAAMVSETGLQHSKPSLLVDYMQKILMHQRLTSSVCASTTCTWWSVTGLDRSRSSKNSWRSLSGVVDGVDGCTGVEGMLSEPSWVSLDPAERAARDGADDEMMLDETSCNRHDNTDQNVCQESFEQRQCHQDCHKIHCLSRDRLGRLLHALQGDI